MDFLCVLAMLNMFLQAKKDAEAKPIELRPFIASEVRDAAMICHLLSHWKLYTY
jgi:hypothetical protein